MQRNDFSITDVRAHWDAVAADYDRINSTFNWTHTERFLTMQKFLKTFSIFRSSFSVLNVWSRTGNAVPYLREMFPGADITNLEASQKMIDIARTKYPQERFEQTDLHDFPCATESQDIIVSLETLEHVPDPLHFLLECHRVLKVGGRLILSCPPAWAEWPLRVYERFFENHGEGPHRFRTVAEILQTLRNCDFTVIEHCGTVLLPVGPQWMKRMAEQLQQ